MIGATLSHYRILQKLGGGGMGVVYEAEDLDLGRRVALKVLPDALADDPQMLERFRREARVASALNHPNICTIHAILEHGGRPVLVMERMHGQTLAERMDGKPMNPATVLALADQLADALEAAHRAGIVHRDLKPANIFVTDHGEAKLLDFGLARRLPVIGSGQGSLGETEVYSGTMTTPGSIMGTVAYMSPEQAQGLPADERSDLFSLGIVLYEMAAGRHPFPRDSAAATLSAILRDPPPPLSRFAPTAPPALDRILRQCLEKDPEARIPSAAALREEFRRLRPGLAAQPGGPRRRALLLAAGAAVLLALGAAGFQKVQRERWVRNEGLPRLAALVERIQGLNEGREAWDAFLLARKIEAAAPREPLLERLGPRYLRRISVTSEPPGARVSVRYYDEPDAPPLFMGTTPLKDQPFPRGFLRVRLERPGSEPVEDLLGNTGLFEEAFSYRLPAPGELPEGMVRLPGGLIELTINGLDPLEKKPVPAFLMDRFEVTNRAFKMFLDAGGYGRREIWPQPFMDDGKAVPWDAAMHRFTDRTGRPGPANWEMGTYPEGAGELPVGGVSWYEAAAYAAWAGKSLPTLFHWNLAACTMASSRIVPMANLAGKGPLAVGRSRSLNRYGIFDLAGNAREWIWNATSQGRDRFILGGAWNDPEYAFTDNFAQPTFDRSASNGFRCIRYLDGDGGRAVLERPMERIYRDFMKEKPVPEATFRQFARQFSYDKGPLDARIEEEKPAASGLRQKITFNAAYGGERMLGYLFLPAGFRPPYQVVVAFPGSGAIEMRSSADLDLGRIDFVQKSGRAVWFPIYKGTYERNDALHTDYPEATTFYKDHVVMWAKDLARSLDYLETRKDLDTTRTLYYGISWGASLGAILPAVEPRIKANILYVAGISFQRALPEADAINYIGHVRQPTLMLDGELDFWFPAQTSQKPMFNLLGTPPEHKRWKLYPGGHSVPRTEQIRESLEWMDRYLGPVAAAGAPK